MHGSGSLIQLDPSRIATLVFFFRIQSPDSGRFVLITGFPLVKVCLGLRKAGERTV